MITEASKRGGRPGRTYRSELNQEDSGKVGRSATTRFIDLFGSNVPPFRPRSLASAEVA